jgi:hypothetical protein
VLGIHFNFATINSMFSRPPTVSAQWWALILSQKFGSRRCITVSLTLGLRHVLLDFKVIMAGNLLSGFACYSGSVKDCHDN